jgi:hypothetical protein
MGGHHTIRARELLVRELWAKGRDSRDIQEEVAAGDPAIGLPPCDTRTVRSYLQRLRGEMAKVDAEDLTHARTQRRGVLRANLLRAHRLADLAEKAGNHGAAVRAAKLVNECVDRLNALDNLNVITVDIKPNESGVSLAGTSALPDLSKISPEVRAALVAVAQAVKTAAAKLPTPES